MGRSGAARYRRAHAARPIYKTIFAHAFMVEELMRWLVADVHGARGLVDALDFSRLLRVHEQSVASGAAALRGYANGIVWRAPFRGRGAHGAGEAWRYLVLFWLGISIAELRFGEMGLHFGGTG